MPRSSGILLHITSLPSPGGIGSLGHEAYAFADFLQASGMRIWQVLPIGPTGYGESPYQSSSVFAGNPLLISCDLLREQGLLKAPPEENFMPAEEEKVDYDAVRKNKTALLRKAFVQSSKRMEKEIEAFRKENPWVEDFALFTALKEKFGGVMWTKWPDAALRLRKPEAMDRARRELKEEISFHVFCQMLFRRQWFDLKRYCNERGILIFGDMPIYVAEDSADTWANPKVFQLNHDRAPKRVAGVPPDYFSEDGQLWGNPLYRWAYLRFIRRFDWWVDRMKGMASLYDMIRIDHFIGFANYYSIPSGAPNARNGKWVIGPQAALFRKLKKEVPDIRIVAEDLGATNKRVRRLLDWCGYPGMKVLCFGFDSDETNPHFIGNYTENYVAYTGTHDNDTALGWAEKADPKVLAFAEKTLGFHGAKEAPAAMVRALFACPCETVIVPMQDLLELGGDARMNYPGTIGGNWLWRMKDGALTADLSMRLYKLNRETSRL